MREDKRFMQVDGKAVEALRIKRGLSIPELAEAAGLSADTIERIERLGGRRRPQTLRKITVALGVQLAQIMTGLSLGTSLAHGYTWEDLIEGAQTVANKIFTNDNLAFDAVLTFPGPSSIFCGLVLAKLPLKVFMRIPVYTAIFLDAKTQISSERKHCFLLLKTGSFTILVPRELLEDEKKRIVVVDDTILTGGVMESLRKYFGSRNVQFACCICDDVYQLPNKKPPEIIGLDVESRHRFPMPWGRDSFCFEDAFKDDD